MALVSTMPRYFFDLTNGDSVIDEVGEEFDLVEAARGHAVAMARELSRNRCSTRRRERSRDRARSSLASPTRTDEPSFHGRLS